MQVVMSYLEVYNEKVYDLLNSIRKNRRGDPKDVQRERETLEVLHAIIICANEASASEV